jgi:hypothetical protein
VALEPVQAAETALGPGSVKYGEQMGRLGQIELLEAPPGAEWAHPSARRAKSLLVSASQQIKDTWRIVGSLLSLPGCVHNQISDARRDLCCDVKHGPRS